MKTSPNRERATHERLYSLSHSVLRLAAVLTTLLTGGFAQNASAQPRGTEAQQAQCMPDVFRLCPTEIPDEEAILACLQSKVRRLTPACRQVIDPGKRVGTNG